MGHNLKSAINVNSLKHYIKEYFHKKLDNAEAGIYSYNQIDSKATFATVLEFMQKLDKYSFTFFFVSISRFFPMLSIFPLRLFS